MNLADLKDRLPRLDGPRNAVRDLWDTLHPLPGGRRVFSLLLGKMAPYSGTVDARVRELSRGRAVVTMADRRAVRNHLESVHAIALVNLAEIAGNIALAYALPDDGRFIVAGLSIDYVKKARGTITAESSFTPPESSERREYDVPVTLRDPSGDVVATATLRTLVGPKKQR